MHHSSMCFSSDKLTIKDMSADTFSIKAIVYFIGKQNYGKSSYDDHPSLNVFVDDTTSYDDIA